MRRSVTSALGRDRQPRWVHRLCLAGAGDLPVAPRDSPRELAEVVASLPAWLVGEQSSRPPHVTHWMTEPTAMGTMPWPVIELPHVGALARLLDVDAGELAWFADTRGLERQRWSAAAALPVGGAAERDPVCDWWLHRSRG